MRVNSCDFNLSTKMSVVSYVFNLKDTLLNGKKTNINDTTTKVKDEGILFTNTGSLLVKTISNGSRCWLIDNMQDIDASYDTRIL